jgi:dihydrofolate reductase
MNHPEIVLIVARATNGVIGKEGRLPWHLPADLRRFKQLTMGKPMIMGRKTFEGLPGILPGRRHIVLTRDRAWLDEGAEVAHSVEEALALANAPHVSVIGGAEVYRLFIDRADRIEITEVADAPQGDTVMDYPAAGQWVEAARSHHAPENGFPGHDFVTLKRRS